MEPKEVLGRYLAEIDAELRASLRDGGNLAPFYGMLRYHLGWVNASFEPASSDVGKRFRSTLCLLACEAVGGDYHTALPAAAAIELIHNSFLIHDDIEDLGSERRHRPTVWRLWGIPQAVNAGDGLSILARLALHRLSAQSVRGDKVLSIIHSLDRACLELAEGQVSGVEF